MVERYRRNQGRRKLLGNHQKCWIWGRNTVTETLNAGRWEILELRLSDALPKDERAGLREAAERHEIPVLVESNEALRKRCSSGEHQGMIAKMTEFPYADVESILGEKLDTPLFVVLDSMQDPYNFGAIVRSADVLGADAVFIGSDEQVGVTSLVARTSAGAVNHIPITRAESLDEAAAGMKATGVQLVAASESADAPLFDCDFRQPTALIIGNEGRGIGGELLQLCDRHVSIPQSGHVGSLNAAIAASVLLYEVSRQRAK